MEICISVLLSVYYKEKPEFLDLALESISKQILHPFEVILVKDGKLTEQLDAVVKKWEKSLQKLKIIQLPENVGLSAALNKGLSVCSGNWVARMDSDDISLPERISETTKFINEHSDADIVGSWARIIDSEGNLKKLLKVPIDPDRIKDLVWTCPMIHPTVCFRKDKILEIGGYNPDAGIRQDDYELWFRCVKKGLKFYNIPLILLLYRFTEDSMLKNSIKVGYHRLIVGFRGNISVGAKPVAYIGIFVPFLRSLAPYPLNLWLYRMLSFFNPRNK